MIKVEGRVNAKRIRKCFKNFDGYASLTNDMLGQFFRYHQYTPKPTCMSNYFMRDATLLEVLH